MANWKHQHKRRKLSKHQLQEVCDLQNLQQHDDSSEIIHDKRMVVEDCLKTEVTELVNHNLMDITTPVNADKLEELLKHSNYNEKESRFLVDGFKNGFDIEYHGPTDRTDRSKNIPIREVGSNQELWDKLMKEVSLGRYVGPFTEIPYRTYIHSPTGLVPKAGGKTRLIFHLSYDFRNHKSVNVHMPTELCSVKYNDLDEVLHLCLNKINKLKKSNTILYFCQDRSFGGFSHDTTKTFGLLLVNHAGYKSSYGRNHVFL